MSHSPGGEQKKPKQADVLVELAKEAKLFHDNEKNAYAMVKIGGHEETHPIRSRDFRLWLRRQFFLTNNGSPSTQAFQNALADIEALALFDGNELEVFTRIAVRDDALYLDLGNAEWQIVEITSTEWSISESIAAPVKFIRRSGMLALPNPVHGGTLSELRQYINVGDGQDGDDSWVLIVSWILASFRHKIPYPVLVLNGEQDSAKTTTSRVCRSLVDPNSAPLRTVPRDERDLAIAAKNSWIVALDNLSYIPHWLSDALCRIATGGGFSTRQLYSDDQEMLFDYQRPVIVNGIEELATRPDLLDRSLILNLPPLPEEKRKSEEEFWSEFEEAWPRILGALLDVVSVALGNLPNVDLKKLKRLADFHKWGVACERALGLEDGTFTRVYTENRDGAIAFALEANPITEEVEVIANRDGGFQGTATELLAELSDLAGEEKIKRKSWPKTPQHLSGKLRRLTPALREQDIEVSFGTKDRKRWIKIALEKNRDDSGLTVSRGSSAERYSATTDVTAGDDGIDSASSLASPQESLVRTGLSTVDDDGDDSDARMQPDSTTVGLVARQPGHYSLASFDPETRTLRAWLQNLVDTGKIDDIQPFSLKAATTVDNPKEFAQSLLGDLSRPQSPRCRNRAAQEDRKLFHQHIEKLGSK